MIRSAILFFLVSSVVLSTAFYKPLAVERKDKLSEFGFFKGDLKDLIAVDNVFAYEVNSALFSNYAEKARFIRLPENTSALYNDSVSFDLPIGTILIKNFYYFNDFRSPEKGRKIIETRLLVHQEKGWEAWPYIWNEDQSEAFYDPAGDLKTLSYIDPKGKKRSIPYAVPNKNQCKGCHVRNNTMLPIGITARQLNRDIMVGDEKHNQLEYWMKNNLLPTTSPISSSPRLHPWNDASSGTLNERARAYLDANCGHCHSRQGPGNTSGLFLDIHESDPLHLGVNKTPVAAGRGAGNLRYDIVPGKPEQSILLFRMKTNDPAIAMPEVGREQVHEEGVALIEEWIRKNAF